MKKTVPILAMIAILITALSVSARDMPPLAGLDWGIGEEACRLSLAAAGYRVAPLSVPERSDDRMLRRRARLYGLAVSEFDRETSGTTERLRAHFYNDALFRVAIRYGDFPKDFRDRTVARLSSELSLSPRHVRGINSGMDLYLWDLGLTGVMFSYKEIPTLPLYFAEVEYRYIPVFEELQRMGLPLDHP